MEKNGAVVVFPMTVAPAQAGVGTNPVLVGVKLHVLVGVAVYQVPVGVGVKEKVIVRVGSMPGVMVLVGVEVRSMVPDGVMVAVEVTVGVGVLVDVPVGELKLTVSVPFKVIHKALKGYPPP